MLMSKDERGLREREEQTPQPSRFSTLIQEIVIKVPTLCFFHEDSRPVTHKENTLWAESRQFVTKWGSGDSSLPFSSLALPCRAVLPSLPLFLVPSTSSLSHPILLHEYHPVFRIQLKQFLPNIALLIDTPPLLQRDTLPTLCLYVWIHILATWHDADFTCLLPQPGKEWGTEPQHRFPLCFPGPVLGTQGGTEMSVAGIN